MQIRWGMWAKDVSEDQFGNISIWKAFDELYVPELPIEADLIAVVKFDADESEHGTEQPIVCRLLDPDGVVLQEDADVTQVPIPDAPKRAIWGYVYQVEGVELADPGEYTLAIQAGGESEIDLPLYVYLVEEGADGDEEAG